MLLGKLPIKKITLYQHGVAFVERRAVFNSTEPLTLQFEDKEMNDILKSLCIFDMGRGKVTGVSYETGEDIAAQMAEKALSVPTGNAALGLFEAARGYNIVMKLEEEAGGGTLMGRLLGLESRTGTRYPMSPDDEGKERPPGLQVVMVDSSDRVTPVPLENIRSLMLDDDFAQSDLEYFLDASRSLRKRSSKSMTVYLEGDEHDLTIGYLTTMPAWKVSYRLIHTHEGTRLQGWGIVENQMEEDLDRIRLSLLSGMPISFIYEIYTPATIERPYVHEDRAGMRIPVSFEEDADLDYEVELPEYGEHETPDYHDRSGYETAFREPEYDEDEIEEEVALTARSELTTTVDSELVDLGEMFRYEIDTPISIKRGQSALVPLFDSLIECEKEHLYNRETTGKNPLVCMLVRNNLGMILDRGPITVIDNGIYSGEAILPFTTYDAENRIAYATDQAVECTPETKRYEEAKDFRREGRNLRVETWLVEKYDYSVDNSKDRKIIAIIEHPASPDCDVFETPKMLEETESYQRWRFEVAPETRSVFTVKQRKLAVAIRDLRELTGKEYEKYVETKLMAPDLAEFCSDIMAKSSDMRGHDRKTRLLQAHINALSADLARLERNMEVLIPPGVPGELRALRLKGELDGDQLVAWGAESARNPREAKLYNRYFEAVSGHRERITRRQEAIDYLAQMNAHLSDTMEHMLGSKRKEHVRKGPKDDLSATVDALLAEDLVKFLINPIQKEGGD